MPIACNLNSIQPGTQKSERNRDVWDVGHGVCVLGFARIASSELGGRAGVGCWVEGLQEAFFKIAEAAVGLRVGSVGF